MNDKFFDLKKEKQARMINAGLRLFALNGYHHASTDDIVKEAHISKGLLFHYFGSKAGYYAFLYNYVNRYAILEFSSMIRTSGQDFFTLQEQLLNAEASVMEQHPFLFLFLQSVRNEDDSEGLSALEEPERNIIDFIDNLVSNSTHSDYLRINDSAKLAQIIHYVKTELTRELFIDHTTPVAEYKSRMSDYIDLLRHLASNM